MPDARDTFRPAVDVGPCAEPEPGFTLGNTSGLNALELDALNGALRRLMARGLSDYEAKSALHAAVGDWLEPDDAAGAVIERRSYCFLAQGIISRAGRAVLKTPGRP